MKNGKKILDDEITKSKNARLLNRINQKYFNKEMIYDKEKLTEAFTDSLHEFFFSNKFIILNDSLTPAAVVFHAYFGGQPPFSTQNKTEFPDAFILFSIEKWAKENFKEMVVISKDNEWVKFCEGSEYLTHYDSIDKFLSEYTKQEKFTEKAREIIENNSDWLKEILAEISLEHEFYAGNGDIDTINISDVDIDEINIIKISEGEAVISVKFNSEINADVSHDDYTYHDNKFHQYGTSSKASARIKSLAYICVIFDEDMNNINEWRDVELSGRKSIDLCDEGWHE
ncbi:MAG: DUF4935 domain-containing protein [Magnetococcales bacterium]|nr:DUF4935 domain-containing protein [Magnetococcales bacterium]